MSDPNMPDPHDRTRRLGDTAGAPLDRTRPLAAREATQALPPAGRSEPLSYTEDYHADEGIDGPYDPQHQGALPEEEAGRTFTTLALVLSCVAALLVGAILTLLLLPEEEPTVVLADEQAQVALVEAQQVNAEQAARITELEAQVAELEGQLAQRDADLAAAQAAAAGDAAAQDEAQRQRDEALNAREAALNDREAALNDREAALDSRETAVAEREQAASQEPSGGFELPAVPDLDIPGELPSIDEDAARSIIERFVDRLQSLFG